MMKPPLFVWLTTALWLGSSLPAFSASPAPPPTASSPSPVRVAARKQRKRRFRLPKPGLKRAKAPTKAVFAGKMQQMVSTAQPLATQAALQVLREGGNAMDAAVTAAFVLAVVEPYASGLGGGGFLLVYDARRKKVESLDFRERAPMRASPTMYSRYGKRGRRLSKRGHLAVGTPGMVAGMAAALRRYGSTSWKRVLEPARVYARKGFPVHTMLANMMRWYAFKLRPYRASRRIFVRRRRWRRGHRLVQKDLGWTLRRLQRFGARDFYRGRIARRIAAEMKRGRGILRMRDLRRYRVRWQKPVAGTYRGHRVFSMGSPSSGGVHLLQMLNLLSAYRLKGLPPTSPKRYHLLVEAMRLAFADRAKYQGDARFAKVPWRGLLSMAYANKLRQQISLKKAMPYKSVKPGNPIPFDRKHTTHLSVVDRWGNAVSMTLTVNTSFGSGVVARGTGIVLNNEMDDFTTFPGKPNAFKLVQSQNNIIRPGKTPLSSMTPTLVFRGKQLCGVVGAPGGPTIITTVLQIVQGMVDHGMDIQQAVRWPRVHHQWKPSVLWIERPTPSNRVVYRLRQLGHKIKFRRWWGNATALWIDKKGRLDGAADPRVDGLADGF